MTDKSLQLLPDNILCDVFKFTYVTSVVALLSKKWFDWATHIVDPTAVAAQTFATIYRKLEKAGMPKIEISKRVMCSIVGLTKWRRVQLEEISYFGELYSCGLFMALCQASSADDWLYTRQAFIEIISATGTVCILTTAEMRNYRLLQYILTHCQALITAHNVFPSLIDITLRNNDFRSLEIVLSHCDKRWDCGHYENLFRASDECATLVFQTLRRRALDDINVYLTHMAINARLPRAQSLMRILTPYLSPAYACARFSN